MIRLYAKKQLARNYARAFLRTFKVSKINQKKLFDGIALLDENYQRYAFAFSTLAISSANIEDRCMGLSTLMKHLKICDALHHLIEVMLRKKQLELMPFLLPALKEEFRKKFECPEVTITSAQPLSKNDQKSLETSIKKHIAGSLSFVYAQDPTLLAGIKIQTPTQYWEDSLARTIRTLEHRLRLQEKV